MDYFRNLLMATSSSSRKSRKNENLIFLHLPKNGGSTLHTILDRMYPKEETFSIEVIDHTRLNIEEFIAWPAEDRAKIRLLKGHMSYGLHEHLQGSSSYITFLRKPVDRILSYYYYVLRRPDHRLHSRIKESGLDVEEFIEGVHEGDVHNAQAHCISGIKDHPDLMLEKAMENIDRHFSFVGLLEHFDESLILLKDIYDWPVPHYKVVNKTDDRMAVSELSDSLVKTIKELNSADVRLYEVIEERFQKALSEKRGMDLDLKKLHTLSAFHSDKRVFKAKQFSEHIWRRLKDRIGLT